MRLPITGLAAAFMVAGCGATPDGGRHVEVENAWVRLPAVPGRPAAAYFHLRTDAGSATLIKVSTPIALRAEMHESMSKGGMASMAPIAQVTIAADSSETFAPRGRHVMLFDVAPTVKPGDTVPLHLTFAGDREPATVKAKVLGAADPAPQP